uniref:Uncharacterized protein n=1 Tax=Arundo donax TaxID=35708 RepID=A0A0A8ZQ78_ARUDO
MFHFSLSFLNWSHIYDHHLAVIRLYVFPKIVY